MSLKRLAAIGLLAASIPLTTVLAQVGEPVVAPWSVDNTPAQSQIRQYATFKAMNNDVSHIGESYSDDTPYQYAPPAEVNAHKLTHISRRPYESARPEPSSPLENMYSERIIDELDQFGYDLFGVPTDNMRGTLDILAQKSPSIPSGAVQDDFVLGEGDELEIIFTGQRTDRDKYSVNSNGMIMIPDFPPIPASGRSIGQLRISLEAAAAQLHNTQVHVSLASVRQIGILVAGHVKRPGRQTLTVFHTVLDALMETGGVEKSGSLRRIKLVRNGRSTFIDLYGLLLHGATNMDLQLKDGDRLIVPPIGPTAAIAGEVKRPGIYELLPETPDIRRFPRPQTGSQTLSLNEMLELAGGILAPGKIRYLKLGITQNGQEQLDEIQDAMKPQFSDGAILMVSKGRERRTASVELAGHTLRPGLHAHSANKTLSQLLSSRDLLGADIYPLLGIIERTDEENLSPVLIDFPLKNVLNHKFDRQLKEGDTVHLFSNAQIEALYDEEALLLAKASYGSREMGSEKDEDIQTLLDDDVMSAFLRERSAFIRGAVRKPGAYPVSQGLTLENVLATAGGLALEANTSNIEVTTAHNGPSKKRMRVNFREDNPKNILIGPGDSLRVNQKFDKIVDKSVLIMGEVHHPGRYDLVPGDRVSDLIERAGGLTDQSYPYGAIFSRESQRKAEEMRFKAQAREMEAAIAEALEADNEKVNAGKIAEARELAAELRNAEGIGRITVEADPATLSIEPELDMLLESGDKLFIPRRGLTVRVSGEVLSPANLQFRQSKASLDYIHEAGGFTYHADKDRTFVIYPDGSAQPLQVSAWNYNPVKIPPGSTVVVPRDPKPFDFIQSAKDVSQILSNLAVTAIFIDDLQDD